MFDSRLFRFAGVAAAAALLAGCAGSGTSSSGSSASSSNIAGGETTAGTVSPDEAMQRLMDGNERFLSGDLANPRSDTARALQTGVGGQYPFVSVLSCADSRVPVELVFDQGIGDVFVVREAGNIATPAEMASLEFGVGALGTNLLVVMGHTKCGAVNAVASGAQLGGNLVALMEPIMPAVDEAKRDMSDGDDLTAMAVRTNTMHQVRRLLTQSDALAGAVRDGNLKIVGAVYDLETGEVEFLGEHPRQAAVIGG
ncbi:MAG: carbonic anhydrase [Planctomycetota bacterium]